MSALVLDLLTTGTAALAATLEWARTHPVPLLLTVGAPALGWEMLARHLADKVSAERICYELVPSRQFAPDAEQIWRYAAQLTRAAGSGPWWAPRRAKAVRIRLRADGRQPLAFRVEGPAAARALLRRSPYPSVEVREAPPVQDKARGRAHVVRGEFVVRGRPGAVMREVPLEPDPLQPLVDAVADLCTSLGDAAELCLDVQPVPRWRLRLRCWSVMAAAREQARKTARRSWADTMQVENSWRAELTQLLTPGAPAGSGAGRWALPTRPRPVDRDKTLGKLSDSTQLMQVQLLVRCTSKTAGRAENRLRQVAAALDVFGGKSRFALRGFGVGPCRFGSDRWPLRAAFDRRWSSGQVRARQQDWLRLEEIAGLLKPPTVHCRMPLPAGQVPHYVEGATGLLPHGWHTGPDGRERLLATPLDDSLFSLSVGKAGYGKTEKALVQAIALARGGQGLLFIDPHGDTWNRAAPYLAHDDVAARVRHLDLAGGQGGQGRIGTWNPLGMDRGQTPHEVVRAVVDAFASVLGWGDTGAPRALTILTKAVEALVSVNAAAVTAGRPDAQATVFQIRTLLTDPAWRESVVTSLDEFSGRWWRTAFPALPPDSIPTVTNPLDRLAADPASRAFLGSPTGAYDIRAAMDAGQVMWLCPAGTGPSDRLLVALMIQDLFRAGLSRRDLPEHRRRPFHVFVDELISIDHAASATLAEITEQLRKFGIRLHAMTQLLERVSPATRNALLQNSSIISTTAGAAESVRHVTAEWGEAVPAAEAAALPRYTHYATLTVRGERIGPLRLRGPRVEEVFPTGAVPRKVPALRRASHTALRARPVPSLVALASTHETTVQDFLHNCTGQTADAPTLPAAGSKPAGSTPSRYS